MRCDETSSFLQEKRVRSKQNHLVIDHLQLLGGQRLVCNNFLMWGAKYQDWLFAVSNASRQGQTEKITKTVQTSKYEWIVFIK